MYASNKLKNEVIEEIIERYGDMVYRLAIARTSDEEYGQEVFQEVFYRLSKSVPDFKSEEHKKAWLIRVTINCSKNILKYKWKYTAYELPENLTEEEKEISDVYEKVLKLPQKYRTVIHLFYYEDIAIKDIANILNTNENTIKTWLVRARARLKDVLEGGFENE